MTEPFWDDDHLTLYGGDCRDVLRDLPAESVHCVVTSPPYWGLRDYGVGGQLGLEPTPEEYVANMVAVFREVRRVLRADGTLWLNLGDSYASSPPGNLDYAASMAKSSGLAGAKSPKYQATLMSGHATKRNTVVGGLKPKDLVGIPWRVAFALQADGWYLRSDIIWSKPNPMPESVTDRPTKAHEYLFLLTKSPRYYYDADAVREPDSGQDAGNGFVRPQRISGGLAGGNPEPWTSGGGRNLRSVWTIATEPYPGAHFATFPRKLVEPCIKAGTSERGVCPECGMPWVRETERILMGGHEAPNARPAVSDAERPESGGGIYAGGRLVSASWNVTTTGWRSSCRHDAGPVPAVVLDPFAGSGTTLLVAQALGRRGVGIDLSPDYLKQALERNRQTPLGLVG